MREADAAMSLQSVNYEPTEKFEDRELARLRREIAALKKLLPKRSHYAGNNIPGSEAAKINCARMRECQSERPIKIKVLPPPKKKWTTEGIRKHFEQAA